MRIDLPYGADKTVIEYKDRNYIVDVRYDDSPTNPSEFDEGMCPTIFVGRNVREDDEWDIKHPERHIEHKDIVKNWTAVLRAVNHTPKDFYDYVEEETGLTTVEVASAANREEYLNEYMAEVHYGQLDVQEIVDLYNAVGINADYSTTRNASLLSVALPEWAKRVGARGSEKDVKSALKTMNQYADGEVYGVVVSVACETCVECADEEYQDCSGDPRVIESVYGFYGMDHEVNGIYEVVTHAIRHANVKPVFAFEGKDQPSAEMHIIERVELFITEKANAKKKAKPDFLKKKKKEPLKGHKPEEVEAMFAILDSLKKKNDAKNKKHNPFSDENEKAIDKAFDLKKGEASKVAAAWLSTLNDGDIEKRAKKALKESRSMRQPQGTVYVGVVDVLNGFDYRTLDNALQQFGRKALERRLRDKTIQRTFFDQDSVILGSEIIKPQEIPYSLDEKVAPVTESVLAGYSVSVAAECFEYLDIMHKEGVNESSEFMGELRGSLGINTPQEAHIITEAWLDTKDLEKSAEDRVLSYVGINESFLKKKSQNVGVDNLNENLNTIEIDLINRLATASRLGKRPLVKFIEDNDLDIIEMIDAYENRRSNVYLSQDELMTALVGNPRNAVQLDVIDRFKKDSRENFHNFQVGDVVQDSVRYYVIGEVNGRWVDVHPVGMTGKPSMKSVPMTASHLKYTDITLSPSDMRNLSDVDVARYM